MSQAIAPTNTERKRGQRKVRLGTVIADKMNKTVIVQVGTSRAHRLYKKTLQQRTRFGMDKTFFPRTASMNQI